MIYTTYYLLTSEGTEIRVSRSFAAIEAEWIPTPTTAWKSTIIIRTYAAAPGPTAG